MNEEGIEDLIGTGPLAERLGVKTETIVKWVHRHPPGSATPCPKPRKTLTRTGKGKRYVYGWELEQLPEWDRWMEDRRQGLPRSREELERIAYEAQFDTSAELEEGLTWVNPKQEGGKNDG
ncbi:hypothetical protein [Saccharopolyspora griseoalba]|uniref:Uncharacterized protein n=1 Tax=Saccharopolyspora griseoalba TaxID=1431848 RepID=A0ABW2LQW2_9PSEU